MVEKSVAALTTLTETEKSAELLPILLRVCPSYRERREKPSANTIADLSKYSNLCKDLGIHLADMLQAGRAAELIPVFTEMDAFQTAHQETDLLSGLMMLFESFLEEAFRRNLDVSPLWTLLAPKIYKVYDWAADRTKCLYDPNPIDGFY